MAKLSFFKQLLYALQRPQSFTYLVTSTFFLQGITLVIAILNTAIIARELGREGKGILQLGTLVSAMLTLFLSGGIGVANVYLAGSKRFRVATLTSLSLTYSLLVTFVGAFIIIIFLITGWAKRLLPGVPLWFLATLLIVFPVELYRSFCSTILQGIQKIVVVNRLALIHNISYLFLNVVFLLVWHLGLEGAAFTYVIASLISFSLTIIWISKEGGLLRPSWQTSIMKQMLSIGLRGYVGNLLQFYNYRLDSFIVNAYLGPAEVGVYGVAVRLAELLWRFPEAVGFVIFPKAAATDKQIMNRLTPRVFRLTLVLTFIGGIILAVVGRPFIKAVYTEEFLNAYIPLLWLLPGVILLGAAKILTNEIAGRGFIHYNSINAGLALMFTVLFDIWLIPRWGIIGAAAASSIAYSLIFVSSLIFYQIAIRKQAQVSTVENV